MRYLRYFIAKMKMSFSRDMTYKGSFVLRMMGMWLFGFFAPISATLIYQRSVGFPGWNFYEYIFFLGITTFMYGLTYMFISNMFFSLRYKLRAGMLDIDLLKPYNLLIYLTFEELNFEHIADLTLSSALIFFALYKLSYFPMLSSLLFGLLLMLSSFLFLYSLNIFISAISIYAIDADMLAMMLHEIFEFGRYPTNIFPSTMRFVLSFIIPYASISYLPAMIFLNKSVQNLNIIIIVNIVFFIASLFAWRFAMRSYQSAGG